MDSDFQPLDYPDYADLFQDDDVAPGSRAMETMDAENPESTDLEHQENPAQSEAMRCFRNESNRLWFHLLARDLMKNHNACFIGGAPAIWDGEKFCFGWNEISRAANMIDDAVTTHELKEIHNYLMRNAPQNEAADPKFIAFSNGALDMDTGELLSATSALYVPNVIPHDYDPQAYDANADRFLEAVSCGDATTRANLEEAIGACFYRGKINGQCPILIGDGSNGKSTFLNVLARVVGPENISSLDIASIGKQFHVGCLAGKLANLGDDISNGRLNGDGLSVFKKAATGDRLHADVKMGMPYDFTPYATLIFSCNDFPSLGDNSNGMMRRLFPIPFNARFSPSIPGFDPQIEAKLTTESALKYLCRLGIEGLKRLLANNGFTANAMSRELMQEIMYDNDNTLQWMEENGYAGAALIGQPIQFAYENYRRWCDEAGLRPLGRPNFTKKIGKRYGLKSKNARVGKDQMRVFAKKE